MGSTTLFNHDGHAFILLDGFGQGEMVPTNQVVIQDGNEAILLDPGGHKVHYEVINEVSSLIPISDLKYLFFSHQDPDIIAAANAWLMLTEADALISKLWVRFLPHFGIDELLLPRLQAIPDEGMRLKLGNTELILLPAHFLHSAGNFQVYDPKSKILFSGDLGASIGPDYLEVTDFNDHIQYMESFHQRYMPSNQANRCWAEMVSELEIEKIVPQHGAIFADAETSRCFIDWIADLPGAVEILKNNYTIPGSEPDAQKSEPVAVDCQTVSDKREESAQQTQAQTEHEAVIQDKSGQPDLKPDEQIDTVESKKTLSWGQRLKSVFKGKPRD
jgi:flavorubredoxin